MLSIGRQVETIALNTRIEIQQSKNAEAGDYGRGKTKSTIDSVDLIGWVSVKEGNKQIKKKEEPPATTTKKYYGKLCFFFRREVLCLCAAGNRGRSRGSSPCRPWCLCCPCGRWKPSTTSSSGRSRTTCRCARPRSTWAAAVGSAAAAAAAAVAAVVAVAVGAAGAAVGAADGAGQPNGRVRCRPDAAAAWLVAAHGSSLRVE